MAYAVYFDRIFWALLQSVRPRLILGWCSALLSFPPNMRQPPPQTRAGILSARASSCHRERYAGRPPNQPTALYDHYDPPSPPQPQRLIVRPTTLVPLVSVLSASSHPSVGPVRHIQTWTSRAPRPTFSSLFGQSREGALTASSAVGACMATMAAATAAAAGQPHFAVGCSTVTLPADCQAGIAYAGGGRVRLSLTDFTGDILFHPAIGGDGDREGALGTVTTAAGASPRALTSVGEPPVRAIVAPAAASPAALATQPHFSLTDVGGPRPSGGVPPPLLGHNQGQPQPSPHVTPSVVSAGGGYPQPAPPPPVAPATSTPPLYFPPPPVAEAPAPAVRRDGLPPPHPDGAATQRLARWLACIEAPGGGGSGHRGWTRRWCLRRWDWRRQWRQCRWGGIFWRRFGCRSRCRWEHRHCRRRRRRRRQWRCPGHGLTADAQPLV